MREEKTRVGRGTRALAAGGMGAGGKKGTVQIVVTPGLSGNFFVDRASNAGFRVACGGGGMLAAH